MAFQVRQNSRLQVDRGASLFTVSTLQLGRGGVVSVWNQAYASRIATPALVANIRGGGVYVENFEKFRQRSYVCNCYGTMRLVAGEEKEESTSVYHEAYWADPENVEGSVLTPAPFINHLDQELESLARLVGQRAPWQMRGEKGTEVKPSAAMGGINGTLD